MEKIRVKKRRVLGYAYKSTKEKHLEVLGQFYDLDTSQLSGNYDELNLAIKEAKAQKVFPEWAKARKFRIVLEEIE